MDETRKSKALNLVLLQMHSDPLNTFNYSIITQPILFGDDLIICMNNIVVTSGTVASEETIIEHTPGNYTHPDCFNVLLDTLGIPRGSQVLFRCL
jgi:hypothetical protein